MAQGQHGTGVASMKYLQQLRLVAGMGLGGGIYRQAPEEAAGHGLGLQASCS